MANNVSMYAGVFSLIQSKIEDEKRLANPYHRGRVAAFRFVLDLLQEHFKPYYTVDVPHRTVYLRPIDGKRLADADGAVYDSFMVRPL